MKNEKIMEQIMLQWALYLKIYPYPGWRAGQCLFNAIYDISPALADEIRGTPNDPFHRDDRLGACLSFLTGKEKEDEV